MITLTREKAQQVLDALYSMNGTEFLCQAAHHPKKDMHKSGEGCPVAARYMEARETLRARLAQPEPEPVAWMYEYGTDHGDAVNQIFWHKNLRLEKPTGLVRNVVPLYTAPPQREWQGLTDEEKEDVLKGSKNAYDAIERIEAKLKEKNT